MYSSLPIVPHLYCAALALQPPEETGVTNVIYNGAHCVMLSGETAKRKYPVQVVQTLTEIKWALISRLTTGNVGVGHFPT